MIGLSFASVPLYSLFCRATGWGGTTQRAAVAPKEVADAFVTVRFDAETAPDLGWEFRPLTRADPGASRRAARGVLSARRIADREPVTGTATYNVTPTKSGIYFDKLQCFCFTEQRLGPRREPRHGRAVLCRSRPGERPLDPRRAARSRCPTRCFANPMPSRPVAGAAGAGAATATRTVN